MNTICFHEHIEQITPNIKNRITIILSKETLGDYRCQIVVGYRNSDMLSRHWKTLDSVVFYGATPKLAYKGAQTVLRQNRNNL